MGYITMALEDPIVDKPIESPRWTLTTAIRCVNHFLVERQRAGNSVSNDHVPKSTTATFTVRPSGFLTVGSVRARQVIVAVIDWLID